MTLFTLWKTDKKEEKVTLIGQSTNEDLLKEKAKELNDNEQFVIKDKGLSILGNNSNFDIFDKNDVKASLGTTHKLDDE